MTNALSAAVAAHRFGLGEADLALIKPDPKSWLRAQIGPADPQVGEGLASALEATFARPEVSLRAARKGAEPASAAEFSRRIQARSAMHREGSGRASEAADKQRMQEREPVLDIAAQDLHARLLTATLTRRPFAERLALFWGNHFTVAGISVKARGLIGAFEREAIRPHIAGSFETLLKASTRHPAMLRYLDNQQSIGPNSPAAVRKGGAGGAARSGLNENLAREVLELHTLGAESSRTPGAVGTGYLQTDVTQFARVLTGWIANDSPDASEASTFDPRRHEPGSKQLLGKTYPEGPQALDMVLRDLALHPATARFLATKLARHFVADDPPKRLVETLAATYLQNKGELIPVYQALLDAPESWEVDAAKLKTPEEFAISSARILRLDQRWLQAARDGGVNVMGQALQRAPSPAGWPDRAVDWLGPEAVWKRIEWTARLIARFGSGVDARALAKASLGNRLSEETARQIERAADGEQALALLLLSPEFQRR